VLNPPTTNPFETPSAAAPTPYLPTVRFADANAEENSLLNMNLSAFTA
jgi:hypothetical protein